MPWDPVHDLLTMQERLESLFGQSQPGWVPAVDLAELDSRYLIHLELPGLTRDQVTLEYHDQVLTVSGKRRAAECCPERYHQLERGQGRFSRTFRFPVAVDPDRISADLVDGVLTIVAEKVAVKHQIAIG